ncbi:MAG: DNA polymerase III subunit alpha [Planctomycetes bacterium]|nr:DNA polymerase III subunit alpha [Planctomycetota bacterium]
MYVPLRVHGFHSLLTGVDAPAVLLERARELGLCALALTDVDSTAGWVDFLKAARRDDGHDAVRPILGAELSDARCDLSGARLDEEHAGRVIALVESERGLANLNKLVSARQLGRDPGRHGADLGTPREDFDLVQALVEHQEGLIYLVDHPRLLLGLMGRVPASQVLAAIAPAGLRRPGEGRRARHGEVRNTHLARVTRDTHSARVTRDTHPARETRDTRDANAASGTRDDRAPHDGDAPLPPTLADALEPPKTPPPARAVPAETLLEAARATGFGVVAVPDVYYAGPGGAEDHRLRVAIKHNALLDDLPEAWLAEGPAHLLTGREVCALYADLDDVPGPWGAAAPPGVPAMVARTVEVAARCAYVPPLDRVLFPKVELAPGESAYSKLCALAFEGATRRYQPLRPEVVRRLDYELATIDQLGFADYFLLVDRIAQYARDEAIPCVGRGSAADSLVAYCLGLTDADPFRYHLIFERFLNPARSDRPDIDLDFCWRRRDEVTSHVYELFGPERTAMISTLNCFGLRAAFRETALAHGFPPAVVNRWSKVLPHYAPSGAGAAFDGSTAVDEDDADARELVDELEPVNDAALAPGGATGLTNQARLAVERERAARRAGEGPDDPIARAFRSTPEAREFPVHDERWRRVLRHASALLDAPRHFGLHPGGVVVAPGPITDYVACQRAAKGVVVTQFDKNGVEAIGLVKMDLLGNRALTVLDDCVRALRAGGVEVDLAALPEDDAATGDTLAEGRSLACFQVESPGMRHLLQQTGARDMDAVIQAVALIRPGPAGSGMKDAYVRRFRGLEPPAPPHPRLTETLWDTQGVMLYQEDVMRVAQALAGMELAEADLLRRALQKRRSEELAPLALRFRTGCEEQGVARADAERVWELVANFASFGFCKAHAVTYGRIAYRAVWLKTHHPAAYLVAFLNSHTGYYKPRVYVEEARRLGVAILPPDVNKSAVEVALEWLGGDGPRDDAGAPALRLGLGTIKGLSQRLLERLVAERARRGPFLSLPDLLERSGAHVDEARHLIQCGALDGFDRTRPELLWRLHLLTTPGRRAPRELARGGADGLDLGQLAACRATPGSRAAEAVAAARAGARGWRGTLGLGNARLAPGESASLFGEPETPALVLPGLPDLDRVQRGELEYELMGLTVHDHPTAIFPPPSDERLAAKAYPRRGRPAPPTPCAELRRFEGGRITLLGWLAASRRVHTSDGQWMRFLTLEDESGLAEVVLFPAVYQRDGARLVDFGPVRVTGTVQNQMGACTLEAERIW